MIGWESNIYIKKHIISELIKYLEEEDNEGMRIAVLDEVCRLHHAVKDSFQGRK